jgi:hypothetical protein
VNIVELIIIIIIIWRVYKYSTLICMDLHRGSRILYIPLVEFEKILNMLPGVLLV